MPPPDHTASTRGAFQHLQYLLPLELSWHFPASYQLVRSQHSSLHTPGLQLWLKVQNLGWGAAGGEAPASLSPPSSPSCHKARPPL